MQRTEIRLSREQNNFDLLRLAAAMLVLLTALFMVALRWLILPKLKPGRYSVFSGIYVRKWIVSLGTEVMLDTLSSIFATLFYC